MIKYFKIVFFYKLVTLNVALLAQESKFNFGVETGIVSSKMKINSNDKSFVKVPVTFNFSIGLPLKYQLKNRLAIISDFNYVNLGVKVVNAKDNDTCTSWSSFSTVINGFEFPVGLVYDINEHFFVSTSFSVNLLNVWKDGASPGEKDDSLLIVDGNDYIKEAFCSQKFKVGYKNHFKSNREYGISLTYNQGFALVERFYVKKCLTNEDKISYWSNGTYFKITGYVFIVKNNSNSNTKK